MALISMNSGQMWLEKDQSQIVTRFGGKRMHPLLYNDENEGLAAHSRLAVCLVTCHIIIPRMEKPPHREQHDTSGSLLKKKV